MNPGDITTNTEAELESFRQQWREEVTARTKVKAPVASRTTGSASSSSSSSKPHPIKRNSLDTVPQAHVRQRSIEQTDDAAPYEYHHLGEKQHGQRLDETTTQTAMALAKGRDPTSALEHYEKAVERESQGSLGDSVNLYRKAFKLDPKVHETYKAKHFPPSYFKKPPRAQPSSSVPESASEIPITSSSSSSKAHDPNPSAASPTVPDSAHHSLQGLSNSLQSLISTFSTLSISGEPPPTEFSPPPPCPISTMPEEILVEVLEQLAVQDMASFARLAQVCKRLAYLVVTEDRVWKRVALGHEYGFAAMHYTWSCQIDGEPLGDDDEGGFVLGSGVNTPSDTDDLAPSQTILTQMLVPSTYPTYRSLFRLRPRIRFNGCYISTVNYTRPGQPSPTSVSWNSPIHIVTYYRYLRFLRDGTCISLLTTSEPTDVVPIDDGAVMGRWRLTGPQMLAEGGDYAGEKEGTVIIETPGAAPKYMNKMVLSVGNAGRSAKNNKLSWQGYWSYNRLTDDWGEYFLKNDRNRAFYWSRVKSFGMAWDEGGMKK